MVEKKCTGKSHPVVGLSLFRSQEWEETRDPRKSQLHKKQEDGEFWYLPFLYNGVLNL